MNLEKYDIVILGASESGTGAALLAKNKGYKVFVSDIQTISNTYKQQLINNNISYEDNTHTADIILSAKEIVKSPGIPNDTPLIQSIKSKKIKIIDEIELAYRYTKAKFIAITGTNGKTTTTLLTYHILKEAGMNVGLAGNIGHSLSKQIIENKYDYYVLEVSSFQLEYLYKFKADIAIILNITPDHLDRYNNDLKEYAKAKLNIISSLTNKDNFIYFKDDYNIKNTINNGLKKIDGSEYEWPKTYTISTTLKDANAHLTSDGQLKFNINNNNISINPPSTLKSQHNAVNAMAAITAALILNINEEKINTALKTFKLPDHRMEWVSKINGIEFYNDSKATNVEATYVALQTFNSPIVWIAGGKDKGNDYSLLHDQVNKKVKAIVFIGKDNHKIKDSFKQITKQYEAKNMLEAVKEAYKFAKPGYIVLLSPACSSQDLFKNFEERGNKFKDSVNTIINSNTN